MIFKNAPKFWFLPKLMEHCREGPQKEIILPNGQTIWVPAREKSVSSIIDRTFLAWKVFKGEADALFWPGNDR